MIKQNANFRVWVCLMLSVNLIEQNSVIKEKILNLDNSIDKVINLWLVDFYAFGFTEILLLRNLNTGNTGVYMNI